MRISAAIILFALCAHDGTVAQTLVPRAAVSAGGHGGGNGTHLSWTVGQAVSATYTDGVVKLTAGVQQPEALLLALNISVLLNGPYDATAHLMHDSLRTRGLLPALEPYGALGLPPVGPQPATDLGPGALATVGPDAVVDWVHVELRDADDPAIIHAARSALVQRDGEVVDADGLALLRIAAAPGAYRLAIRHRNHLPVLTLNAITFNTGTNTIDLTNGGVPLHVPDGQVMRDGRRLLWEGDVNGNGSVRYTGTNNDRDPVLVAIGSTTPNNAITGYLPTDVNLDGTVKYTGARNDRDPILITIGGTIPTAVRTQPLP